MADKVSSGFLKKIQRFTDEENHASRVRAIDRSCAMLAENLTDQLYAEFIVIAIPRPINYQTGDVGEIEDEKVMAQVLTSMRSTKAIRLMELMIAQKTFYADPVTTDLKKMN